MRQCPPHRKVAVAPRPADPDNSPPVMTPPSDQTAHPGTQLLFLAMALMESFGIQVEMCTEPEYSAVEGFALEPGRRAIIANWVRSEAIWHVDTTARRSVLSTCREAAGHVRAGNG